MKSRSILSTATPLLACVALSSLLLSVSDARAQGNRPQAVRQLEQGMIEALGNLGHNNVRTVIIVQPGDKFTVFVPDPAAGTEFNYKADGQPKARLPMPGSGTRGKVGEVRFQELIAVRRGSPATVVVCDTSGGDKICWEEQR